MSSVLKGLVFYCKHRDLEDSKFWRLRLICRDADRAVQSNIVMWRGWPFGSRVPRNFPLGIVCAKRIDSHLIIVLEVPNRKLIGDLFIYALRRSLSNLMQHRIREYQLELSRRRKHVRLGYTDVNTAECKELENLMDCLRQKRLEYGIFIDTF